MENTKDFKYLNNIDIIKSVLSDKPMYIEHINEELKSNISIVRIAFNHENKSLKFSSKYVLMCLLEDKPMSLEFASDIHKSDLEIIKKAFD